MLHEEIKNLKRNPKDTLFVGIQLLLFIAYLFRIQGIDFAFPVWLQQVGLLIAIAGIIISFTALFDLNKNLSPFPTPKENAELIQTGIYKFIRHPIYTGILSFSFGFSLYSENTLRLCIFFALVILFIFKATYEERLLQNKYPGYIAYKKTTGMFLPRLNRPLIKK